MRYQSFQIVFILISVFGLNSKCLAKGLPPEVRFCRAAVDANSSDDVALHFMTINNVPFCVYGGAAIGYRTLYDIVESGIEDTALSIYKSNNLAAKQQGFDCSANDNCTLQAGHIIDESGRNQGLVYYYLFSDGSLMEKNTLDRGPNDSINSELNSAIAKRNISY